VKLSNDIVFRMLHLTRVYVFGINKRISLLCCNVPTTVGLDTRTVHRYLSAHLDRQPKTRLENKNI
jgi:hypothetical protein